MHTYSSVHWVNVTSDSFFLLAHESFFLSAQDFLWHVWIEELEMGFDKDEDVGSG